jgi:sugar/nucleoside kinase (ribokinase family)
LLLTPLTEDDLDVASFLDLPAAARSVLAQGLQRVMAPDGAVTLKEQPSADLLALAGDTTSVFLAASEVAAWPLGELERLAERVARVVVTGGAEGARVYRPGKTALDVAPEPADVVDTTGAGDAFATAYTWALAEGADDVEAGRLASRIAARMTEVVGAGALPAGSRAGAA